MTNEQAIMYLTRLKDRINFEVTDAQGKMDALNMAIQALQKLDEIARIINCDNPVSGELPFQIQEDVFKYKMICEVMNNE